jgi:predicted dehydrogenase
VSGLGRAPRVAVVGPRRVRTGLGPFLAQHLVAAGAEVPAFVASRPETLDAGRAALRAVGVEARGFVGLEALLRAEQVDALVIATPHDAHLEWLAGALGRGLHVLCEKPLVWGDPPPLREARTLVRQALDEELVLFENCPWPYALPAFETLHPSARDGGVRTFEMEMAPSSTGRAMLVDAMSHPLSVLQELASRGEARLDVRRWSAVERDRIEVEFSYEPLGGPPIRASVLLRHEGRQPRSLSLAVNGRRAERRVRMDDYSFVWTNGAREVPLPDPMAALVARFVRVLRDGEPRAEAELRLQRIGDRLRLLPEIVGSFPGG